MAQMLIGLLLHLDASVRAILQEYGPYSYAVFAAIIFCETGLVVTPFLPGDSMLFLLGAISATGTVRADIIFITLAAAAVLGDAANYHIGAYAQTRMCKTAKTPWIQKNHLETVERFFKRHGGKAVILARFMPIVRTGVPFVAGVSRMPYKVFFLYNVTGAVLWIGLMLFAGYFFGNIPLIKNNLSITIMTIIIISCLPALKGLRKKESAVQKKNMIH